MAELKDLLVNGQSRLVGDTTYKTHTAGDNSDKLASTAYVKNAIDAIPAGSDTKNTTGTTNKANTKLFLAGAETQGDNPVTYSNSNVYIGTDNQLYSLGTAVKTKLTAVSDITKDSAVATAVIESITQNTNGVISPVKKSLPSVSVVTSGTGNVVTSVAASGHVVTANLGSVSSTDEKVKVSTSVSTSTFPVMAVNSSVITSGNTYEAISSPIVINPGKYSVAEGESTIAYGEASHAEGGDTTASSDYSHAEGFYTTASGSASHAEGSYTTASEYASHAEGRYTSADGTASHAEGTNTTTSGDYSHAEGDSTTASGITSHTEGDSTTASGDSSHAEGDSTTAYGWVSHAEGVGSLSQLSNISSRTATTITFSALPNDIKIGFVIRDESAAYAKITDINTSTNVVTLDSDLSTTEDLYLVRGVAYGYASHTESEETTASGSASHAEGSYTTASGSASHAEGQETTASGPISHAEGYITIASGWISHAEGCETEASGPYSHAEGYMTKAVYETIDTGIKAYGRYAADSIYFGTSPGDIFNVGDILLINDNKYTINSVNTSGPYYLIFHTDISNEDVNYARTNNLLKLIYDGKYSHVEGCGTIAYNEAEHAEGKYNLSHSNTIHSIGIGSSSTRKNAVEVLDNGDVYINGIGNYNGTNIASANTLQEEINSCVTSEEIQTVLDVSVTVTSRIPIVDKTSDTSTNSFTIDPNKMYMFGTRTILTITLATPTDNTIVNEYMFLFTSGSTATTLNVPNTVVWLQDPDILTGKKYLVSIENNLGIIGEWSNE